MRSMQKKGLGFQVMEVLGAGGLLDFENICDAEAQEQHKHKQLSRLGRIGFMHACA